MKNVVMVRHGKKQGELIDPQQLDEIRANGIPALNPYLKGEPRIVICLGSGLERTAQTITAFTYYMGNRGIKPTKILKGDPLFGNARLFGEMTGNGKLMEKQKEVGWYKALQEIDFLLLKKIQIGENHALTKIFDALEDGEIALSVGHTPMIELLGQFIDDEKTLSGDLSLGELRGISFQENNKGAISVVGQVG